MDGERVALLQAIQALEFAALDLNLYLDTHPWDQRALADYNCLVGRAEEARGRYEMKYGPLVVFGFSPSGYPWRWIEEPWPWQVKY